MPFLLFFWMLQRVSATTASLPSYLIPMIALAGGALLLGEQVTPLMAVGGALILAGSGVHRTGRAGGRRPPGRAPKSPPDPIRPPVGRSARLSPCPRRSSPPGASASPTASIVALHDVSLDVPAGCIGLVGANGAGKTTLLKLLLGILRPGEGAAWALGHSIPAEALAVRSRVGYMPESACLPPDQTAADFVGYAAELAGLSTRAARQRASDVLGLVGLHEERFRHMGGFSTGMKQRAKLAQAIVHDPDLVLLDEPTAGLDPEGREEMLELIGRLDGFGINAVVSSHVLTDIERTCQWVVMLDGGGVLRSGPLTEISATGEVAVEVLDDPAPPGGGPGGGRCRRRGAGPGGGGARRRRRPLRPGARRPGRHRHGGAPPGAAPHHPGRRLPAGSRR